MIPRIRTGKTQLVATINRRPTDAFELWAPAHVVSVNTTTKRATCYWLHRGTSSDTFSVAYMKHYTPVAGDTVWIAQVAPRVRIIVGAQAV
jgi:hypothetical protein